jgi:hypothetical protein
MIDAAKAIPIPEKWPDRRAAYVAYFTAAAENFFRYANGSVYITRPVSAWEPEQGDPIVVWDENISPNARLTIMFLHSEKCSDHCALVESLSDLGHTVAWFLANRKHT